MSSAVAALAVVRRHLETHHPAALWGVPIAGLSRDLRADARADDERRTGWAAHTSVRPAAVEGGPEGPAVLYWRGGELWRARLGDPSGGLGGRDSGRPLEEERVSRNLDAVLDMGAGARVCSRDGAVTVAGMRLQERRAEYGVVAALRVTPVSERTVQLMGCHPHDSVADLAWTADGGFLIVTVSATGVSSSFLISDREYRPFRPEKARHLRPRKLLDGVPAVVRDRAAGPEEDDRVVVQLQQLSSAVVPTSCAEFTLPMADPARLEGGAPAGSFEIFTSCEHMDIIYFEADHFGPTGLCVFGAPDGSEMAFLRHPLGRHPLRRVFGRAPDWFRVLRAEPYCALMGRGDCLLRAVLDQEGRVDVRAARLRGAAGRSVGPPVASSANCGTVACPVGEDGDRWVVVILEAAPWVAE